MLDARLFVAQHLAEQRDLVLESRVLGHHPLDLANGMQHRGVVAAAEALGDVWERA